MGFIDSYKWLEKLCGEIYGNNHGVTSYIDEMKSIPNGAFYVWGWDNDLKQLKHYRWIRNQIVHEPSCTEENMCDPDDAWWLDHFRSRIMTASDPLALYRETIYSKAVQIPKEIPTYPQSHRHEKKITQNTDNSNLLYVIGVLLIAAATVLIVVNMT